MFCIKVLCFNEFFHDLSNANSMPEICELVDAHHIKEGFSAKIRQFKDCLEASYTRPLVI